MTDPIEVFSILVVKHSNDDLELLVKFPQRNEGDDEDEGHLHISEIECISNMLKQVIHNLNHESLNKYV